MIFCKVCGIELNENTRYKGVRTHLCKTHWNKHRTELVHKNPTTRRKTYEAIKRYELKNNRTIKRRKQLIEINKRQRTKFPLKYKAREKLKYAIKRGVIKKNPCQLCGNINSHGHHHVGYDEKNWLNVIWLCPQHHKDEHRKIYDIRTI